MGNTLRVTHSEFKTDLTFNEWARHTQASTLWDETTNRRNKEFIDKYRNYIFAEAFPKQSQIHEFAV